MTVVTGTVEEYVVTVENGAEPQIDIEITSGGDPIDILVQTKDADDVALTVDTDTEIVQVPAEEAVEVAVDGFEVLIQVDDVPMGPPGPPGTGGSAGTFVFLQPIPATVWTIHHGLGFDPAGITVVDEDGYFLDGFGVAYYDPGQGVRLSFDLPFAGTARLS